MRGLFMSGAAALAFPGSRTLAGWWRQLVPHRPVRLWVGYLSVHRVEALALARRPRTLDAVDALLLSAVDLALSAGHRPTDVIADVEARLALGRPLVVQALRRLEAEGLVNRDAAAWTLTERGVEARRQGAYATRVLERRRFCFVQGDDPSGCAPGELPAHFLDVQPCPAAPWTPSADERFDAGWLGGAATQTPEWKALFGFPAEVEAVLPPRPDAANALDAHAHDLPAPLEWQCVAVDRPERVLGALIEDADGGVRGFAAQQQGWHLHADKPILAVSAGGRSAIPALSAAPEAEHARRAWRAWGAQKGLSEAELDACQLVETTGRLRIGMPESAATRAARHELLKGETWLLLGDRQLRPAVRLEAE